MMRELSRGTWGSSTGCGSSGRETWAGWGWVVKGWRWVGVEAMWGLGDLAPRGLKVG